MNAANKDRWGSIIIAGLVAVALVGCSLDTSTLCKSGDTTVLSAYIPARSLSGEEPSRKGDRDMGINVWTDGLDDDAWDGAGNWDGGVPGAADTVIFPAGIGGSPNSGLTQTAVKLALLHTQAGFKGNIGESGNPLQICADRVVHEGDGTLYYEDKSVGADTTDMVVINSPNQNLAAHLLGSTISNIAAKRGYVTIASTLGANFKLFVTEQSPALPTAVVIGAATGGYVYMLGGVVTAANSEVIQRGGILTIGQNNDVLGKFILLGGVCNMNMREPPAGDAFLPMVIAGGTMDFTQDARPCASANSDIVLLPGGHIRAYQNQLTAAPLYNLGGWFEEM